MYIIFKQISAMNSIAFDILKHPNGQNRTFTIIADAKAFRDRLQQDRKYYIVEVGAEDTFRGQIKYKNYMNRRGIPYVVPDIITKD